jgi:hypothetical protein
VKVFYFCFLFLSLNTQAQEWGFLEDLTPDDALESDYGVNMVFADDLLVVAWPRIFTREADADNCGEVITYQKVDGNYQEMARLTAEDLTGSCVDGDGFGFGLDYDNGRLAIGMPAGVRGKLGNSGGATDADSKVFITTFEEGNWVLQQTLSNSDLGNGKGMGFHVVLKDDVLLVFAHEYDTIFGFTFPVATGVYVYENNGNDFEENQKLEENFHLFGQDFDYANQQIIVGAWGEQAITQPGRIYVYEKSDDSWQVVQTINDTRNSNLGNQIEILGDTMVAGSVQAGGIGGVTVFTYNNGTWEETQYIQASDKAVNDQFGIALQLDEDELVVGAGAGQDPQQTLGAVYTFSKGDDGQYVEQQKLIAQNPSDLYDRFAGNLIFNGSDMLVSSTSGGFNDAEFTTFHHFVRESTGTNTSYPVDSKVSGTWMPENVNNQKLSLEILEGNLAVMFGSLNNEGNNYWIIAVGIINENTIDFDRVVSTSGARFGNDFNASDVIRSNAGQAQINFNQCNKAVLTYDLTGINTSEITLIKEMEIPGNECTSNNKALPNGISGAWFDSSRSGEGFTVYLSNQGKQQIVTVTWYTYGENGEQLWLSGSATVVDQSINISEIKQFTGANLFSGNAQETIMGSLSMSWDDCNSAIVNYDFQVGNLGSGQMNLTQLTHLENTQCDLKREFNRH